MSAPAPATPPTQPQTDQDGATSRAAAAGDSSSTSRKRKHSEEAGSETEAKSDHQATTGSTSSGSASSGAKRPSRWTAPLAQKVNHSFTQVRSRLLAGDLLDSTAATRQQFEIFREAIRSLKAKPLDWNYVDPESDGRTLLMLMVNLWYECDASAGGDFDKLITALCEEDLSHYNVTAIDDASRSIFNHLAWIQPDRESDPILVLLRKLLALPGAATAINQPDLTEDGNGGTLMMVWARVKCHLSAFDLLLQAGADPSIANHDESTLLHEVVSRKNASLLEHLLSTSAFALGLDFFHRNYRGQTFFDLAACKFAARPDNRVRQRIAALCEAFLDTWHSDIVPAMKDQLADEECTGLPMDLVDLVTQYVDGHGRPFEGEEQEEEGEEDAMEVDEEKQRAAADADADGDGDGSLLRAVGAAPSSSDTDESVAEEEEEGGEEEEDGHWDDRDQSDYESASSVD